MVGEAQYQGNLERICGPRKEEGENFVVDAVLLPEDANPYDVNAICVWISGLPVGYLSRANAVAYRRELRSQVGTVTKAKCRAVIRGGWERGEEGLDRGHYGVWLDVPTGPG